MNNQSTNEMTISPEALQVLGGGGDDDAIERRLLLPALGAVGGLGRDVVDAQADPFTQAIRFQTQRQHLTHVFRGELVSLQFLHIAECDLINFGLFQGSNQIC